MEDTIRKTLAWIKEDYPGADAEVLGKMLHEAMARIISRLNDSKDRGIFHPNFSEGIDIPLNGEHIEFDPEEATSATQAKYDRSNLHIVASEEALKRSKKLQESTEKLQIHGVGGTKYADMIQRQFDSIGISMDKITSSPFRSEYPRDISYQDSRELNKLILAGQRKEKPVKRKKPYPVPKKKRGKKK